MSYRDVDWMKPADEAILRFMSDNSIWMKPATLSRNLSFSRQWVGDRVRELHEHSLVETDDGYYRISEKGKQFEANGFDSDFL